MIHYASDADIAVCIESSWAYLCHLYLSLSFISVYNSRNDNHKFARLLKFCDAKERQNSRINNCRTKIGRQLEFRFVRSFNKVSSTLKKFDSL